MDASIRSNLKADLESICESLALRRPVDPAVAERAQERGAKILEELKRRGLPPMADELLRASRGE